MDCFYCILKQSSWFLSKRLIDPFNWRANKSFKKIITTHKSSSLIEYLNFRENNLFPILDIYKEIMQHLFINLKSKQHVLFLYDAKGLPIW